MECRLIRCDCEAGHRIHLWFFVKAVANNRVLQNRGIAWPGEPVSDFQAGAFTVELVLFDEMSLHFQSFISVQNKSRTWAFLSGGKCVSAIRIYVCLIGFTLWSSVTKRQFSYSCFPYVKGGLLYRQHTMYEEHLHMSVPHGYQQQV